MLCKSGIGYTVKEIGKKAGIKNLKPHDFRHSFSSHLNESRCHPETIRVLRGDSNRNITSYYTRILVQTNLEKNMKEVSQNWEYEPLNKFIA